MKIVTFIGMWVALIMVAIVWGVVVGLTGLPLIISVPIGLLLGFTCGTTLMVLWTERYVK